MYPLSAAYISSSLVAYLDEQLRRANCAAAHVVAGPDGPVLIGIAWPNPQIPLTTHDHRLLEAGAAGDNMPQIPPIPLIHPQLDSFLHAERLTARVNALACTGDSERAAIMYALLLEAAR